MFKATEEVDIPGFQCLLYPHFNHIKQKSSTYEDYKSTKTYPTKSFKAKFLTMLHLIQLNHERINGH